MKISSPALVALFLLFAPICAHAQAELPYDIHGSDFDQKVIADSAAQPVVVLFRSEACESCATMIVQTPMMAFGAFAGNVKFYTVNVNAEPELASKLGVATTPTVIVFKAGEAAGTKEGPVDDNPLFQFFAGLAPAGAKEAYQETPEEMKPKRPPGADLATIGSWKIDRGDDGVAYSLTPTGYLKDSATVTVGPWTVDGYAALSLRYDARKEETVWDVVYSQEITRPATAEDVQKYGADATTIEMPGSRVSMRLDGDQVANLPDPLEVHADEIADAIDDGHVVGGYLQGVDRHRTQFVVANHYLVEFGREPTPQSFEKRFVDGHRLTFSIYVDGQDVVLSELEMQDTKKALNYLKGERTYAWRKYNDVRVNP